MQSKAVLVLTTAFIFASATVAGAQLSNVEMLPSRFSFGGDLAISQPKGEFANNVPNGYGLDLTGRCRLVRTAKDLDASAHALQGTAAPAGPPGLPTSDGRPGTPTVDRWRGTRRWTRLNTTRTTRGD